MLSKPWALLARMLDIFEEDMYVSSCSLLYPFHPSLQLFKEHLFIKKERKEENRNGGAWCFVEFLNQDMKTGKRDIYVGNQVLHSVKEKSCSLPSIIIPQIPLSPMARHYLRLLAVQTELLQEHPSQLPHLQSWHIDCTAHSLLTYLLLFTY